MDDYEKGPRYVIADFVPQSMPDFDLTCEGFDPLGQAKPPLTHDVGAGIVAYFNKGEDAEEVCDRLNFITPPFINNGEVECRWGVMETDEYNEKDFDSSHEEFLSLYDGDEVIGVVFEMNPVAKYMILAVLNAGVV